MALLALLLVVAPLFAANAPGLSYLLRLLVIGLLYVACAVAWDLVGGLTGQVSFGHSVFFGIGAFATAILVRAGVPLLLTMPVAAACAAAYGAVWGWPCLDYADLSSPSPRLAWEKSRASSLSIGRA